MSNEGKLSFEKRGVINLKIWDKMQLLFSIYEFYSKVGVKLEILKFDTKYDDLEFCIFEL